MVFQGLQEGDILLLVFGDRMHAWLLGGLEKYWRYSGERRGLLYSFSFK